MAQRMAPQSLVLRRAEGMSMTRATVVAQNVSRAVLSRGEPYTGSTDL